MRRLPGLMAGVLVAGVLVTPVGAPRAGAAQKLQSNCTLDQPTNRVTCTFGYTGAEQTFAVPDGVTSIAVRAVGAAGGAGFNQITSSYDPGGRGAAVTASLAVGPATLPSGVLYIKVGQALDTASTESGSTPSGAFNGGGPAGYGHVAGAGGGATDLRTVSRAAGDASSLPSRLLVAGGGGGYSETYQNAAAPADAGRDAQPDAASAASGQGGRAGSQTDGGDGGQGAFFNPSLSVQGRKGADGCSATATATAAPVRLACPRPAELVGATTEAAEVVAAVMPATLPPAEVAAGHRWCHPAGPSR